MVLLIDPGIDAQEIKPEGEGIRIEAEKENEDSRTESSIGTTILSTKKYDIRAATIADVLEREASVRVRRYGGRGAYSTLSLRGSNPNQINIYIDGIPVTGASNGEFNISDLNLDSFEKIEIHRSGSYPGSAIGGSINLITKKSAQKKPGGRIKAIAGSHKTFGLGADYHGAKFLNYTVITKAETSDQKYKFTNHNGTPILNPYDDFEDRRQNAWYKNYFGTLNLGKKYNDTSFFFLNDSALRYHGIPGAIPRQTKKTKRKNFRNTSGFGLDSKGLFWENFRLKSRTYYSDNRNSHFDPEQEFASNQPNSKSRLNQYGLHIEPVIYLLDYYQTIRIYLAAEAEEFRSDKRNKFDMLLERQPTRFRYHQTARLSDEFSFFDDRIVLIPAAEYQQYEDRFNEPQNTQTDFLFQNKDTKGSEISNYKFSSKFVFWKEQKYQFSFLAGAHSANRVASFLELFGERGSIIGNTKLEPEKAVTTEAGLGFETRSDFLDGKLEVIGFQRKIDDMILLVPNSRFTLRPENIDNAQIDGVEVTSNAKIMNFIKLYVNYTYQRAINTSDERSVEGKFLPLRPLHESTSGFSFFSDFWEAGTEVVYVGAIFRNRTNEPDAWSPPSWIWNLFFSYAIFQVKDKKKERIEEELTIGLQIKNLQNRRNTDITEFPLPGRTAFITLNWKF